MKWNDTLIALVENGPLYDGDVPSKSERDALLASGDAVKVLVRGEDGYQAATYKGRETYVQMMQAENFAQAKAKRVAHSATVRACAQTS